MTKVDNARLLTNLYSTISDRFQEFPLVNSSDDFVFGSGNPEASMVFIGEAPGSLEMVEKKPFVGRSGQLLRKTLTKIGINIDDIYITNVVKTRPPNNRDPKATEVALFQPILFQELAIIKPKLVVTLGKFALQQFLPKAIITKVHGQQWLINWQGQEFSIYPVFHPAYALRSSQAKELFIKDINKLKEYLV